MAAPIEINISKLEFFDLHIDGEDTNFTMLRAPQEVMLEEEGFDKDNADVLMSNINLDVLIPCPPRCDEGSSTYCIDEDIEAVAFMSKYFSETSLDLAFDYDEYIDRFVQNPLRLDLNYLTTDGIIAGSSDQMCKPLLENLYTRRGGNYYAIPNTEESSALFVGYDHDPVGDRYPADGNWIQGASRTYSAFIKEIVSQVSSSSDVYPDVYGSVRVRNGATFFAGNGDFSITLESDKIEINAPCSRGLTYSFSFNGLEAGYSEGMTDFGARALGDRESCEAAVLESVPASSSITYKSAGLLVQA